MWTYYIILKSKNNIYKITFIKLKLVYTKKYSVHMKLALPVKWHRKV